MFAAIEEKIGAAAASAAAPALQAFLPGLNPSDISLKLFSGVIEVKNVSVAKSLFDNALGDLLPWRISSLSIGRVFLRLPLFNLLESPVDIQLDDVHAVLNGPDYSDDHRKSLPSSYTPKLRTIPPVETDSPQSPDPEHYTNTVLRVISAIAGNIRVSITSFRVDVRDVVTNTKHPYEAQLRLAELKLNRCDEDANLVLTELPRYQPTLRYAIQLQDLCVALGVPKCTPPLPGDDSGRDQLGMDIGQDNVLLALRGRSSVYPVVCHGTLSDHRDCNVCDEPAPFLACRIMCSEIEATASDEQMSLVWDILDRIQWWTKVQEVAWIRPRSRISDCPGKWWHFTYHSLLQELDTTIAKMGRTTWHSVVRNAKLRRRYMRLYRRFKRSKRPLKMEEAIDLERLDQHFSLDCLRRFRADTDRKYEKKSWISRIRAWVENFSGKKFQKSKEDAGVLHGSDETDNSMADSMLDDSRLESDYEDSRADALDFLKPNEPSVFLKMNLETSRLRLSLRNVAPKAGACALADLRLHPVLVSFSMDMDCAHLSASVDLGSTVDSTSEVDIPSESHAVVSSNNIFEPLRLICSQKRLLSASWSMDCESDCTKMKVDVCLEQAKISLPGPVLNRIILFVFPDEFDRDAHTDWWLVDPQLYSTEIALVQAELAQRGVSTPFRMAINANVAPLTVQASNGMSNSSFVQVQLCDVVFSCGIATKDGAASKKFPDFKVHEHVVSVKSSLSIYDYFHAHIGAVNILYSLNGNIVQRDVLNIGHQYKRLSESHAGVCVSGASNNYAVEIDALVAMASKDDAPPVLVDGTIAPMQLVISNDFYVTLMDVIFSFAPVQSEHAPSTHIDTQKNEETLKNTEAIIEGLGDFINEEMNIWGNFGTMQSDVHPLRNVSHLMPRKCDPDCVSRVTLRIPSLEAVLVDFLGDESIDVFRASVFDVKIVGQMRPDLTMKATVLASVEAWYLNHQVRLWEPLIEPWTVAVQHRSDSSVTCDLQVKGDVRPLNITVSSALAENAIHVCQTFKILPSPKNMTTFSSRNIVLNNSGLPIRFNVYGDNAGSVFVKDGESVPMSLPKSFRFGRVPALTVQWEDGRCIKNVTAQEGTSESDGVAIVNVKLVNGVTVVHVRSACVIRNETAHELDIAVNTSLNSSSERSMSSYVIPGDAEFDVPVQALMNSGHVFFRLRKHSVKFSEPIILESAKTASDKMFSLNLKPSLDSQGSNIASNSVVERKNSSVALNCAPKGHDCRVLVRRQVFDGEVQLKVMPVMTFDNLLYTGCEYRISDDSSGENVVLEGQLECGQSMECFSASSSLFASIRIPGSKFSQPVAIAGEAASASKKRRLFRKTALQTVPIEFRLIDESQNNVSSYLEVEIEKAVEDIGTCDVKLYAPYWVVNHTNELAYVCEPSEMQKSFKISTYPNLSNQGIPLLMFGRSSPSSKAMFSLENSEWSKTLNIAELERGESITVLRQSWKDRQDSFSRQGETALRLKIERASGRFRRTKIISIMPQLILINCLKEDIFVRQNAHEEVSRVPALSRCCDYAWPNANNPRNFRLSFNSDAKSKLWSGLCSLVTIGEQPLLVPKNLNNNLRSVPVVLVVKQHLNMVFAVFKMADLKFPPLRVVNRTRFSLDSGQAKTSTWSCVPPFSCADLYWLEPLWPKSLELRIEGQDTSQYDMDAIEGTVQDWKTPKAMLRVTSRVDGPTNMLIIEEPSKNHKRSWNDTRTCEVYDEEHYERVEQQLALAESALRFVEKRRQREIENLERMHTRPSKLFIEVVEAWDLAVADANGFSDPFVEIFAGESAIRGKTISECLDPRFNEEFCIEIRDVHSEIIVQVSDQDMVRNEVLGGFSVELSSIADQSVHDEWFPLFKVRKHVVDCQKRKKGQLRLKLQWIRSIEAMKQRLCSEADKQQLKAQKTLDFLLKEKSRLDILASTTSQKEAEHVEQALGTTLTGVQSLGKTIRKNKMTTIPSSSKHCKQRILSGKFRIGVLSAKQVLGVDRDGKSSDPYSTLLYGTSQFQTAVKSKTLNPEWHEFFEFDFVRVPGIRGLALRISLFDRDNVSADDFIGEALIYPCDFIDLPTIQLTQEWYSLSSLNERADDMFNQELGDAAISRGDVLISFEWLEKEVESYAFDVSLDIQLPLLGISVVDSGFKRELMYLSVSDTVLNFQLRDEWKDYFLWFSVSRIQIDNPDVESGGGDASRMVVFDNVRDASSMPQPLIQLCVMSKLISEGFDFFPYASLLIQSIKLQTNTRWISNVLWFAQNLADLVFAGYPEARPPPLPLLARTDMESFGASAGRKFFFGELSLSPISITATIQSGLESIEQRHTELDWILEVISSVNLQGVPIRLNALSMVNVLSSYDDLMNVIIMHYVKAAILQAANVLGSSNALGNPVGLVSSVGTGVKDFFYEPAQGFVSGPADFGRGVAKGTVSLLSGAMSGALNSASKITATIGQGFASIAMDDQYAADLKRAQNQVDDGGHVVSNVASGAKGIMSGVTGIVVDPIKGAKNAGLKGFVKGVGKGIVGAVAKPVSGAMQVTSAVAGGIRNAASGINENNTKRSILARWPRAFYGDQGLIKTYDSKDSKAAMFLAVVKGGKYRKEVYQTEMDLVDGNCLILSDRRLALLQMNARKAVFHRLELSTKWTELIAAISSLEMEDDENKLAVKHPDNSSTSVDISQLQASHVLAFCNKFKAVQLQIASRGILPSEDDSIDEKDWESKSVQDRSSSEIVDELPDRKIAQVRQSISQLNTEMEAAIERNCYLEAFVQCGVGLEDPDSIGKARLFCKLKIVRKQTSKDVSSGVSKLAKQTGSTTQKVSCQTEPIASLSPEWNYRCILPVESKNSSELVVKVCSKGKFGDNEVGSARVNIDALPMHEPKSTVLELFRSKSKHPSRPRGRVELILRLANDQYAALQSNHFEQKRRLAQLEKPQESETPVDNEDITAVSDLTQSTDGEDSQAEELKPQPTTVEDDISSIDQALAENKNDGIGVEILKGRILCAKPQNEVKAHPYYVAVSLEDQSFQSVQMKSYEPEWRMRFFLNVPKPQSKEVRIRVRRKHFLGAKRVGKLNIPFDELIRVASCPEGFWLKLSQLDNVRSSDTDQSTTAESMNYAACEILVRVRLSPALESSLQHGHTPS